MFYLSGAKNNFRGWWRWARLAALPAFFPAVILHVLLEVATDEAWDGEKIAS